MFHGKHPPHHPIGDARSRTEAGTVSVSS